MNDPGMVSMFQALIASGLEGFLGCTAVVYETALVDFFENATVRDGVIISTVAGQLVEISEEWFAETFELPVDGGRNSAVDGARVKRHRFMDQQMREFRVTSCWFGKTVEEVERRRFDKLKRCVLEPAARGLWYLKFSDSKRCRLNKSIRQRFAFTLKIQQMACAMIKPAGSHSYLESAGAVVELEKKPAATIQQQRFSSDANSAATQLQQLPFSDAYFVFSTEILDAKQGSLYRKLHHGNSKRFLTRTKADFVQELRALMADARIPHLCAYKYQRTTTKFLTPLENPSVRTAANSRQNSAEVSPNPLAKVLRKLRRVQKLCYQISHRNPASSCAKFSRSRTPIPDFVLPDFHPQNLNGKWAFSK
ncbi:hypothetical protein F511_12599 [Dorcoceras hygrometricum]|uniref:Uncharacterized protein n=1 Tax=Dorcoceras hygrometricum TaxID=472368 RepID=A0A2Z7D207_9LAMI|nr:hypothetical protein F511_12599 [Dorcoceras hygrometricum]